MWWQYYAPNPIALQIGAVQLRWYGVLITLAIMLAYGMARRLYSRVGQRAIIDDAVFWIIIAGIIGARLFHVFVFEWSYYQSHLWQVLMIWNGGIAIQGALVGGVVALIAFCWRKKVSLWPLLDSLVPALALGQAIGRWGNYFNQELYGLPTSGWWGIYIDPEHRAPSTEYHALFHPTFLYESILMLVTSYLLLVIWARTKNNLNGRVFASYLIAYGLIRFGMDYIRIDPELMWQGLKLSQCLSLALLITGTILFFCKRKKTI